MDNLEYAVVVWEIYLEMGNYDTLHYIFRWYDVYTAPKEYLPFMFTYDNDY